MHGHLGLITHHSPNAGTPEMGTPLWRAKSRSRIPRSWRGARSALKSASLAWRVASRCETILATDSLWVRWPCFPALNGPWGQNCGVWEGREGYMMSRTGIPGQSSAYSVQGDWQGSASRCTRDVCRGSDPQGCSQYMREGLGLRRDGQENIGSQTHRSRWGT